MAEEREESRAERAEEAKSEEEKAEERRVEAAKAEEEAKAKQPMPKKAPRAGDIVLHHGAPAIVTHVHGPRHVSVTTFTRSGPSNVAEPQEYDRDWTERPEEE